MSEPEELRQTTSDFVEHYRLLDEMEQAGLPEQLDQDARDLHRLIRDHAWSYEKTSHGDMTIPLVRSLARLVQAAAEASKERERVIQIVQDIFTEDAGHPSYGSIFARKIRAALEPK